MVNNIVIIEKNAEIKDFEFKNDKLADLYKKCNYRKSDGFIKLYSWKKIKYNKQDYNIDLYGKNDGKANNENKYDFPPPIDNELYFGNLALVRIKDNKIDNLTVKEWGKIYEQLFGGFEDLSKTVKEDENEKAVL